MISIASVLIALVISLGAVTAGSALPLPQPQPGPGIITPIDTIVAHP